MTYLALGVIGFVIIHLSDPAAIKKLPGVKPTAWVVGVGLMGFAAFMACTWPDKLQLPVWATYVGWGLLVASSPLVVYALFINLPFLKTYVASGVSKTLVTTGLYSLVRHPGVLWSILFVSSLVLVSGSRLMLVAMPLFLALDIAAVTIQDHVFFPRMFAGYDEYQRRTPMLIPTRKSTGIFLGSLRLSAHALRARLVSNRKEATNVHTS